MMMILCHIVYLFVDAAAVGADAGVELAQDGVSGRDLGPGEVHLVGPVLQLEELHPVPVCLSVQGLGGPTGHLDQRVGR